MWRAGAAMMTAAALVCSSCDTAWDWPETRVLEGDASVRVLTPVISASIPCSVKPSVLAISESNMAVSLFAAHGLVEFGNDIAGDIDAVFMIDQPRALFVENSGEAVFLAIGLHDLNQLLDDGLKDLFSLLQFALVVLAGILEIADLAFVLGFLCRVWLPG